MCADFAIHDKGTGNPHVHIMLTLRPLKENGQWGAKCRKAYDLDENGQRIPDGKGGWKNHREDTTDWNDKENEEIWRAAWAAYTLSLIHIFNEFVEKILVHERARKGSQDTTQKIEIYFNFLGRYIPPSLQPVSYTHLDVYKRQLSGSANEKVQPGREIVRRCDACHHVRGKKE